MHVPLLDFSEYESEDKQPHFKVVIRQNPDTENAVRVFDFNYIEVDIFKSSLFNWTEILKWNVYWRLIFYLLFER